MKTIFKNGLYIPVDPEKEYWEKRRANEAEYDRRHCCCPECGHKGQVTTCMGYIMTDLETHQDRNQCQCRCGWVGIIHDRVPEKINENNDTTL